MSERQVPYSRDAEAFVLGSIVIAPACLDELIDLKEDDFYLPAHRAIWAAAAAVKAKGRAVDVLSIGDEIEARGEGMRLEGGEGYLTKIAAEVPTVANVDHYARVVRDKSALRRIIALASEVQSRAYGCPEVDEVIGQLREGLAELEAGGSGGPVRVSALVDEAYGVIESRATKPAEHAIMSGVQEFDAKIGGFKRSQLVVIAGPPGGGKSAAGGCIAVNNAVRAVPALVVSYEMDRQELLERYLAGQSKVAGIKLATGRMTPDEWRSIMSAAGRLKQVPLWIDDRNLSLSQLCGTIRRWHSKHVAGAGKRAGVIVVDYLGLIKPDRDEKTREREVAKMSAALKAVAKSLRNPILLLSQLNREHAKQGRKPIIQDLRDSGGVEADADMVIFPWREPVRNEETNQMVQPTSSGPAVWIVGKHRGGPTGEIDVWFDAPSMVFEDRQRHARMPYAD